MIILFGVVGSGKSEQANLLVERLHCPHVSTSQLLREHSNPQHEAIMQAGKLVDDENIFELLEPELKKVHAESQEFILDGAPRSVKQAEWLVNKIKAGEVKLTAIIHLKVSKETTLKRLLNRGREDDTEVVITERFRQYESVTNPVLDYLRQQGYKVFDIDGENPLDDVQQEVWQVVKDKINASQKR